MFIAMINISIKSEILSHVTKCQRYLLSLYNNIVIFIYHTENIDQKHLKYAKPNETQIHIKQYSKT